MKFLHRLRALFRKNTLDREMSEELRHHLELQTEANIAAGMTPDEARYAAQRSFGGIEQIKERARDQRVWRWLDELLQDVRFAVRTLRKSPSFTITAVLTLALGIGVNTALFTTYDAIALRALPVQEPDTLVKLYGEANRGRTFLPGFSYLEYLDYRDGNHVLSGIAAVNEITNTLTDPTSDTSETLDPLFSSRGPGTVVIQGVSNNYLPLLGAKMAFGRGFRPEENRAPGSGPVIVLSYPFWTSYFHGDPNVLGKTISLSQTTYTVVGVTAEEFVGHTPAPPAGWIPLMMWSAKYPSNYEKREIKAFRLIGRLLPGVSQEQARADLSLVAARLAKLYPSNDAKESIRLEAGMKFVDLPKGPQALAAMAPLLLGFGMVLVIACTNVANLLLARGVRRQPEIGVRLTLGASRGRVIRQLLTENLLLCSLAAVTGLLFAMWTLQILRPLVLAELPLEWNAMTRQFRFLAFGVDYRVAGFTAVMAMFAAIIAGLMPSIHAVKADLFTVMKAPARSRLRNFLIISQVAICLTLLSSTGLFFRNLLALRHFDLGFDTQRLYHSFVVPNGPLPGDVTPQEFRRRAAETLRSFPMVSSTCQTVLGPLIGGNGISTPLRTVGSMPKLVDCNFAFVTPGFFTTFGIPLRNGRSFDQPETDAGLRVAVVSQALAEWLWPGEDAVGKLLDVGEVAYTFPARPQSRLADFRKFQVIGVSRNEHGGGWDTTQRMIYLPFTAEVAPKNRGDICVRLNDDSTATMADLSKRAVAAGFTFLDHRSFAQDFKNQQLPLRGVAVLSGALGALALLMATVGLYGAMSFNVNQRTREIGIRVALGASAEKVVKLFLRQGLRLILVGTLFGLVGSALFALLLRRMMFGLGGAWDPIVFGDVAVALTSISLLACWLPARRATKVDPLVALRHE